MENIVFSSSPDPSRKFGSLLREWRGARGMSQLALSLRAEVSARHLSYLETGRASPSRDMVLTLGEALDLPLRERNSLLVSAGFAAVYRETPLSAAALEPVRRAVKLLLQSTAPNPTFVVNRRYDVLEANEAGRWILSTFVEEPSHFASPLNLALLLVSPQGMRPHVENWADVARKVLGRIRREIGGGHTRDRDDEAVLAAAAQVLEELGDRPNVTDGSLPLVPVRLKRGALALHLFTTIATLGTPLDVTLQELRIEMLFPADEETRRVLAERQDG
jgi:transcriptional regulator with XRE-family HTH domain